MSSSPPAAPGLGVALYLLGVFLFALNDALGKWLVADYGVGQLMMLRSVGAGVVLAPMVAVAARRPVRLRPGAAAGAAHPLHGGRYVRVLSRDALPAARRRDDLLYGGAADPRRAVGAAARREGRALPLDRGRASASSACVVALRPSPSMFSWASLLALFGATMFALGQTVDAQAQAHALAAAGRLAIRRRRADRRGDDAVRLDDAEPASTWR